MVQCNRPNKAYSRLGRPFARFANRLPPMGSAAASFGNNFGEIVDGGAGERLAAIEYADERARAGLWNAYTRETTEGVGKDAGDQRKDQ